MTFDSIRKTHRQFILGLKLLQSLKLCIDRISLRVLRSLLGNAIADYARLENNGESDP